VLAVLLLVDEDAGWGVRLRIRRGEFKAASGGIGIGEVEEDIIVGRGALFFASSQISFEST